MFKRFCLVSLICLHALSWGVTPALQAKDSSPKLSLSQFFGASLQSLVTKTLEIDAANVYTPISSKGVLQALRKFLPVVYQKGTASGSQMCPKVPSYKIGDFAQGGVVIWVTEDGEHGLVVAIENAALNGTYNLAWGPTTTQTNATLHHSLSFTYSAGTSPAENYSGYQNQQIIKSLDNDFSDYPAFAAAASYTYTMHSKIYDDWFLPSSSELSIMFAIRGKINEIALAEGGQLLNQFTWSSREDNTANAWYMDFSNYEDGLQNNSNKSNTAYVRCVRAF